MKIHILIEISTDIGHKIISTEILTEIGQNFSPTCLPRDHVCNFLTEQSVKIRSQTQFWPKLSVKISVKRYILTEILTDFGQNFSPDMPAHGILFAFCWPHSRSKFGHKPNFDRNCRSKFLSNQNFDRLSIKIFGHRLILTDCQAVEISVKILWPPGHNEISTHVFPTDRSRSKFRSKCTNSVKILGFFGQISVKINIRFCSIYAGSQTCYNCVVGNSHQW